MLHITTIPKFKGFKPLISTKLSHFKDWHS